MTAMQREPTNDQLWAQPPTSPSPSSAPLPVPAQPSPPLQAAVGRPAGKQFALAVVSLCLAIPLTGIASGSMFQMMLTWAGIVAVNAVYWMSTARGRTGE